MAGPRKTPEQKVEELNQKIAYHENRVAELKEKKEAILHPVSYQDIINEARRQKISPKKLAETLGMNITSVKDKQEVQPEDSEQDE